MHISSHFMPIWPICTISNILDIGALFTIFVDNYCSKTISNQVSKGLLIGKESKINLVPKLEIYNDDVECSHGAASGQPDKNTLFYLTSRGISKEEAEQIYVEGFLSEFFETIDNASMAEKAKNFINLNT